MDFEFEKSPTTWALKLKNRSTEEWLAKALENFDAFLQDHASCERKASATCLGFVVKYKDKARIVNELTNLALEELEHFKQVKDVLAQKNLEIGGDEKDLYVNELLKLARNETKARFLDRLLIFGIVEARGTERFGMIAKHHPQPEMREFYRELASAEAKHQALFVELALEYFSKEEVYSRLEELLFQEAKIVESLPIEGKLH